MEISVPQQKLINIAVQQALVSSMKSHHGAVLALRGKVISTGTNHSRGYINGQTVVSCHAEIDALYSFVRQSRQCKLSCPSVVQV
jgi:deoxycytidylate deaminase